MITNAQIEILSLALVYEGPLDENYDQHITKLQNLADADYRTVIDRTCEIFNANALNFFITPDDVENLVQS
jgi:hypothetical protein